MLSSFGIDFISQEVSFRDAASRNQSFPWASM